MRLAPDQQIIGSNPVAPIHQKNYRSVAQVRVIRRRICKARACRYCKGRGSNPLTPTLFLHNIIFLTCQEHIHHNSKLLINNICFFLIINQNIMHSRLINPFQFLRIRFNISSMNIIL